MEKLNLQTFKEKIVDFEKSKDWNFKGTRPAIIDFYADWCGPCRMVGPILEELAEEYKGKLDIYKVDTQNQPELAGLFGIRSIPSLLFIPVGEKPQMMAGALPKEAFQDAIAELLKVPKTDENKE
jgi:thioredoxin 1